MKQYGNVPKFFRLAIQKPEARNISTQDAVTISGHHQESFRHL